MRTQGGDTHVESLVEEGVVHLVGLGGIAPGGSFVACMPLFGGLADGGGDIWDDNNDVNDVDGDAVTYLSHI